MNQPSLVPCLLSDYTSIVVEHIVGKYNLTAETALRRFVFSETYRMLSNPDLEMWEFSPEVIFEMWECEQITGNPRNSCYIRGE